MKINSCFTVISLIFIILITSSIKPLQSQPLNDVHFRKGVWGDPPIQYKFKNVPENIGFLTEFPLEQIKKEVEEENLSSIVIEYWIFTSISDTEMAMVERLNMSSLAMCNAIDNPLANGQLGDNCWYQPTVGVITFLKNNVYVSIAPKMNSASIDFAKTEEIARKIETVLEGSSKVTESSKIPAPVISSIDILSDLPKNTDDKVQIKVHATNVNADTLYFRKYATGFGIVSENGELNLSFNNNTDFPEKQNEAVVKIWVWNEHHIVSSIEHVIPF